VPLQTTDILFSDMFCEGLAQLGNSAARFELDSGKHPTINCFGKVSKRLLQALLN